jgi:hypothetical protein
LNFTPVIIRRAIGKSIVLRGDTVIHRVRLVELDWSARKVRSLAEGGTPFGQPFILLDLGSSTVPLVLGGSARVGDSWVLLMKMEWTVEGGPSAVLGITAPPEVVISRGDYGRRGLTTARAVV